MRYIHEVALTNDSEQHVPCFEDTRWLSVEMTGLGVPIATCLVNPDLPLRSYYFRILASHEAADDIERFLYLGSLRKDGSLYLGQNRHVFVERV